jgi:RNA polymerase sigma factor (sigma-70 family)
MQDQFKTDRVLIDSYLVGNQASLEKLIQRHKKRVYSYIQMVVKDHQLAEDIFQDTFIKVIYTLRTGTYNDEGKFVSWVMRIAHNLMIDHFRKSQRIPTVENEDEFDIFETLEVFEENVEDRIVTEQIHNDVRSLIEFLPPEQKEVVILRHFSDMSFREIAEETNVSINTALGRMRYALINLRKLMEEQELELTRE